MKVPFDGTAFDTSFIICKLNVIQVKFTVP